MRAKTQYELTPADTQTILALVRAGTLAEAALRLGVDASTMFRAVQRIERGLGQRLFERSRTGYRATPLGQQLARHAERIESELTAARSSVQASSHRVSGSVHITTTDTVLYGLVLPALRDFAQLHPALSFELTANNSLASLTKRDADIAVRATQRAPEHLVGKKVGPLRIAAFAAKSSGIHAGDLDTLARCDWVAPDSSLGDHPSVLWRKRHCPGVQPRYRTNSVMAVLEIVARGFGVGILPVLLARGRDDLVQLTPALDEAESQIWVLAHPESRHLPHVAAVFTHLATWLAHDVADDGGH
ncbi:LysR family transcriptional regulator [Paraburkholderia megapolitana]|uniref:DNA-binding transcriptional regulator, LysR family n=1 Tax=Paraburkholderia megapolitana TaxID=420953 RepID=A0A1I3U9D7_9BURK|nr:LysR family transcriptional regulator [Paraburkholderia megapolitana]QDQ83593.1 LysR family transcriptional regulator [Paraburkholderia megapolitana]SFJ80188.1 DNA-binding transcriptional regulator, LysR family [Paraburkholderia megapolitana]